MTEFGACNLRQHIPGSMRSSWGIAPGGMAQHGCSAAPACSSARPFKHRYSHPGNACLPLGDRLPQLCSARPHCASSSALKDAKRIHCSARLCCSHIKLEFCRRRWRRAYAAWCCRCTTRDYTMRWRTSCCQPLTPHESWRPEQPAPPTFTVRCHSACTKFACTALQVYNRELDNEMEDFMLSAYDATCELEARAAGGSPTFTVRYLPMGRGKSRTVIETGVVLERLRPAPQMSSPHEVLE